MSQRPALLPTTILNSTQAHYLEQISDQEFWQHAEELAHVQFTSSVKPEEYLECDLMPGRVIIPLAALQEVIPAVNHLAKLPASPPWMAGVTAWKGQAIAVIDLIAYFAQKRAQTYNDQILLIAQAANITLGLVVTIRGTHTTILDEQIQPFDPTALTNIDPLIEIIRGTYTGAFILDIPTLLTNMVQHLQVKSYE